MKMRTVVLASLAAAAIATGGAAWAQDQSAANQALRAKAIAACNSPQYPNGARPLINYSGGWFRCVEPNTGKH